ncbi:MAG: hypothetical protein IKA22_08210 [Lentisphaeria bacterium]|nr:hypothetical protein [Lentisphaeria bacterium]
MKKLLSLCCVIFTLVNVYGVWNAERTAAFLKEMDKAGNPHNAAKNIKSMKIVIDCTFKKLNIPMSLTTIYKSPDKMKQIVIIPGVQQETVYFNGQKGFSVDSVGGVTPVEGVMLEQMKAAVKLITPGISLTEIFDKVEIADTLEERDGKKYVAITCNFKPEQKLSAYKILADPQTKLPVYVFVKQLSQLGSIEVITHNLEFKELNGIVIPVKSVQTMLNMQIEHNLKSFIINQNYPDSDFEYKE